MMNEYVVGFMFNKEVTKVLLILKNRPNWQAGKWNGIGGKIEECDGGSALAAMIREFEEETGIKTNKDTWQESGTFFKNSGSECLWRVNVFYCFDNVQEAKSTTDERVEAIELSKLDLYPLLPNLKWLIPMVLTEHMNRFYVEVDFPDF